MVDESAEGVSVGEDEVAKRTQESVTDEVLAKVRNEYRKSYIDFLEFVYSIEEPVKMTSDNIQVCTDMIKTLAVRATTVHVVMRIREYEGICHGTRKKEKDDILGSGGQVQ